jgi:hypothetical protein
MNTIYTFLENMFSTLPKTDVVIKAKENLYQIMIEKYDNYKKEGKSENESVGLVISEFGNIDELLEELDIQIEKQDVKIITKNESNEMIDVYTKQASRIAYGLLIMFIGASFILLLIHFSDAMGLPGVLWLWALLLGFLFAIPSIGLFISAGLKMSNYDHLFEDDYHVASDSRYGLEQAHDNHRRIYQQNILVSVLIILSSTPFFVVSWMMDDLILVIIALGVLVSSYGIFRLTKVGIRMMAFNKLLKKGDYRPNVKEAEKITEIVASVVFPLAIALYLAVSLFTRRWDITWIIWPVVAIAFGGFAAGVEEYHKYKKK